VVLTFFAALLLAQSTRTSYFMNTSFYRSELNPALRPERGYINLGVGNTMFDLNMGKMSLNKLIYIDPAGNPNWALNDPAIGRSLLKDLGSMNKSSYELGIHPFGLGFYIKDYFFSFNVALKQKGYFNLPTDLLDFAVNGYTPDKKGNYSMKDAAFSQMSYAEFALGASKPLNDKLTVGLKLKYLRGFNYADVKFNKFDITLNGDKWAVDGDAVARGVISTYQGTPGGTFNMDVFTDKIDNTGVTPVGNGGAIDLGVTYKAMNNLTLSAGLIDLGAIYWGKKYSTKASVVYNQTLFDVAKNVEDQFQDIPEPDAVILPQSAFSTMLPTSLYAGAEYSLFKDKLSFGLLSSNRFGQYNFSDVTLSANYKPWRMLNTSVSYSYANNGFKTMGAAISWTPAWFLNMFVASDHIFTQVTPEYIPINVSHTNFQIGFSIPLAARKVKKSADVPQVTMASPLDTVKTDSVVPPVSDSSAVVKDTLVAVIDTVAKVVPVDTLRKDYVVQYKDSSSVDSHKVKAVKTVKKKASVRKKATYRTHTSSGSGRTKVSANTGKNKETGAVRYVVTKRLTIYTIRTTYYHPAPLPWYERAIRAVQDSWRSLG